MSKQEADPIKPIQIDHVIDEVEDGTKLDQRYNFLDYHFERDDAYCRARTYASKFQVMVLFGPYADRSSGLKIYKPDFEHDVLVYLQRRFRRVDRRHD